MTARKVVGATKKVAKRSATKNPELEAFKQRVIDAVMDHPDGCTQGRRDFLEGLGLEYPEISKSFTVEFVFDTAEFVGINEHDIENVLGRFFEYESLMVTEDDV